MDTRAQLSKAEQAANAGVRILKRGRATTGEAARVLYVTLPTILKYIRGGQLEAIQIGGRKYVTIESLVNAGAHLPSPFVLEIPPPKEIDSNDDVNDIGDYYD